MGKEKKQFPSQDRNSKSSGKNIHKDQPTTHKGKDQTHYGYNQRNINYNRGSDKKSFTSNDYTSYNKPRINPVALGSPTLNSTPSTNLNKNVKVPKAEQIEQALSALGAL
jgi:hypothetical protein